MADPKDQRARARIRLEFNARIRQIAPPRSLIEVTRTLDVSRNGILFRTHQPYDVHGTVWVTMPFVENALAKDIEFPGSVVRVLRQQDGAAEIAVQFHSAHADRFRSSYQAGAAPVVHDAHSQKRRPRVRMTLPIRVRHQKAAEESVTVDVSRSGVLFRTDKAYTQGDPVMVCMPFQPAGEHQEVPAVVIRTVQRADVRGVALHFASAMTESAKAWGSPSAYAR